MNKLTMSGRLTKDAEIRKGDTKNGSYTIASFSIAVDRRFKRDGEPTADFFNCVAFGKTAEVIEKYVTKGTKLIINGNLQNNKYTNKNGDTVYDLRIHVEEIEFCERRNANSNSGNANATVPSDGFMNVPDDISDSELPFN